MDPKDLRFAATHEWARLEGDTCTIGITKFAAISGSRRSQTLQTSWKDDGDMSSRLPRS